MNSSKNSKSQYEKMMYTPIPRLIISLSIPTIISMMVTNLYNIVDTAFVGTLGTSASGAVGIVFGFMAIMQAIGFTFGQGSGSQIARKLGAQDVEEASRIASTGLFFSFAFSVLASIICFVKLDDLVMLLGSTETIAPFAKTYISFILMTAPFVVAGFTMNNILRYEGKAVFGMIGLLSGAVINIAGDALFMFVFHMGIAGAGLSTALSQVVSFCVLLSAFLRGKTQSKLSIHSVMWRFDRVLDIVETGCPSLLRQGLNSITTILLNSQAKVYGDAAVAAMSINNRLFFFLFSVALGVGQGFQPVSGFSYGAKRIDRLKKAYRFTFLLAESLMVVLGALFFIFTPQLFKLMRDDPEVILIGTRALRLQCIAVLALPICMVTEMMMQSTGQKLLAVILSSLRSGILFIPCLLVLSHLRGLSGIQEAYPLSFLLAFPPACYIAVRFFNRLKNVETAPD